jgi:hypothetical protein
LLAANEGSADPESGEHQQGRGHACAVLGVRVTPETNGEHGGKRDRGAERVGRACLGWGRGPRAAAIGRGGDSTITGTFGRNPAPHQKLCSSAPPSNGPIAAPAAKQLIQIAIASRRCSESPNMFWISASADGARVPPATPIRARAAISIPALVENAASSDAIANAPPPSSRRRAIGLRWSPS